MANGAPILSIGHLWIFNRWQEIKWEITNEDLGIATKNGDKEDVKKKETELIVKPSICCLCEKVITMNDSYFDGPNGIGLTCIDCQEKGVFFPGQNFKVIGHRQKKLTENDIAIVRDTIEFAILVDGRWYKGYGIKGYTHATIDYENGPTLDEIRKILRKYRTHPKVIGKGDFFESQILAQQLKEKRAKKTVELPVTLNFNYLVEIIKKLQARSKSKSK